MSVRAKLLSHKLVNLRFGHVLKKPLCRYPFVSDVILKHNIGANSIVP